MPRFRLKIVFVMVTIVAAIVAMSNNEKPREFDQILEFFELFVWDLPLTLTNLRWVFIGVFLFSAIVAFDLGYRHYNWLSALFRAVDYEYACVVYSFTLIIAFHIWTVVRFVGRYL